MSISASTYYECLVSFVATEGIATKGMVLKGDHTLVANHEPLWIEIGKTEAEKIALARASAYGGPG